jgi:hypothetical protein
MSLCADQAENKLMVCFVEARRVDDVRCLNPIDEIEERNSSGLQTSHVRDDMKLRDLSTLHNNGTDSVHAIQWRLKVVCSNLPQLSL